MADAPRPTEYGVAVAVDWSSSSTAALRWAGAEAALHGCTLTLVHVVVPVVFDTRDPRLRTRIERWLEHRGRSLLTDARKSVEAAGDVPADQVRTELLFDAPVKRLVELSQKASMLVVGSRFHGSLGGRRLGSVSAGVACRAHCPVVVVHDFEQYRFELPVLVGVDGSPASERAVAVAFDEASRRRVGVIAVHAWSDVGVFPLLGMDWQEHRQEADEVLAERLAGWQEQYPDVAIERHLYCDVPAHHLQRESRRAGLVVLGSHGRGQAATLVLGSVATAVAESVDTPVMIVRGEPDSRRT